MRPTREGRVTPDRAGLIFKGVGTDPDVPTTDPAPPTDLATDGSAFVPFLPPPDPGPATDLNLGFGTDYDGGGIRPVTNPTYANDGSIATLAGRSSYYNGSGTDTWWLEADLGSAMDVDDIVIYGGWGNAGENDPHWSIQHSDDSSTWATAVGTYVWDDSPNPNIATLTLTSTATKRYWRIGQSVGPGFTYPLKVHTWQINGPSGGDPTNIIWVEAPLTVDGSDSTYDYAYDTGITEFWRVDLGDTYLIDSVSARLAFETAGSNPILLQGANEADYSDAVTIVTIPVTATGSFTAQDITGSWTPTSVYRYWQLVQTTEDDIRIYTVELFGVQTGTGITDHGDLSGRDAADQHPADAVTLDDAAGWFEAIEVEGGLEELAAKVVGYQSHGTMGATETFDAAIGWHSATLNANCTFTLTANPSGTVSSLFLELLQNGTGGWTITLPSSVVNKTDLEADQVTTLDTTSLLVLLSRDGGTTWYGGWWGGTSGFDLTIQDEGTPLATFATTLNFVGAGVVASGTGATKTITIAGATVTADQLTALGVVGPILISDTHSTPMVFADLLTTEDADDLLYATLGA